MKSLFIIVLLAQFNISLAEDSVDGTFSSSTSYTDQEMNDAKTFVHQGKKDEAYKQGCQGLKNCNPSAADNDGVLFKGSVGSLLEQNLGKLYGLLFGGASFLQGGGAPKISAVAKAEKGQTQATRKDINLTKDQSKELARNGEVQTKNGKVEEKNDYCMYIAISYEFLAGLMQASLQKSADNTVPNDPQLQALVNLKQTHEARKKTATYQATAYGATTACYALRLLDPTIIANKMYIAKMAAAGALSTLYIAKAKKHADAASKVQLVIDSLPKAGDCNPWTGTQCFCKEATSKTLYPNQYNEVCILNNGNFNVTKSAMGCGTIVDGKMQLDKECKCKQTNSCFMPNLKIYNPNLKVSSNLMAQANKGYSLLGNDFDQAKMDSYITDSQAVGKAVLAKVDLKTIPNVSLSDAQKQEAEGLKDVLPTPLANLAASLPPKDAPGGGVMSNISASALSKLPEETKKKLSEVEAIKINTTPSNTANSQGPKEEEMTLPNLTGDKVEVENTEIVNYAEKAISQADVANAPETQLFDIISNRYRRSGWEKLSNEEKK
ncbi:MAG: hypothetical protein AB7I27_03670 [Bacteriovoracaceae bacterium]